MPRLRTRSAHSRTSTDPPRRSSAGLSKWIKLLIVGICAFLVTPQLIAATGKKRVRALAKTLQDDLELARRTAMNRQKHVSVYFDWKGRTYHSPDLHADAHDSPLPADCGEQERDPLANCFDSDVQITGNFSDQTGICFTPDGSLRTEDTHGTPTSAVEITVQLDGYRTKLLVRPGMSLVE
ncbi:MAG: GspH/FimT family pseudopilin [Rhodopirellula sp. JB053]